MTYQAWAAQTPDYVSYSGSILFMVADHRDDVIRYVGEAWMRDGENYRQGWRRAYRQGYRAVKVNVTRA